MSGRKKILVIEDNMMLAETYVDLLRSSGYDVLEVASTGEEAIMTAESNRPDLVLMDIGLRGSMDGIETSKVITESIEVPVVFIAGVNDGASMERMASIPNHRFLVKPVDFKVLERTVRELLE